MFNIPELIKRQELCWNNIAEHQCLDKDSIWYGGFNYAYTHEMTRILIEGLPMYCNANSAHFRNDDILRRMTLNSEFLLKYQHESGLISLLDCNIQSPPDTAFMVNDLAICHFYIKKSGMAELEVIDNNVLKFMERSMDALAAGGFHTPNHRWVICCALGFLYEIFKIEKLKDRARELLSEGIDINADGEWTERSNACYNAVSDLYMYHIGKIFGVPEAINAVRKNLDMMKFLLHPNDYIVTEYSTRQDKGQIAYMDSRYTITYGLMAAEDNNSEYVYMAERALERTTDFGRILLYFGVYEKEIAAQISSKPISNEYIRLINRGAVTAVPKQKSMFGDSVLRYRKGDLSVTVMAGQPDFVFLQYKNARMFGMRFTVGWFGMGGVSFPTIEELDGNRYRLAATFRGKYMQTLPESLTDSLNGNFNAFPNELREDVNKVEFSAECIVSLTEKGIELEFSVAGQEFLFTQLVCMLDCGGELSGEDTEALSEYAIRQNGGRSVYEHDGSRLVFDGCGGEHDLKVIRGDALNKDAVNLVFNMITPKKRKITISCE